MREKGAHLSDEDILLFIDRELPSRCQRTAGAHLAECPLCRARRVEFEGTLAEFSTIHEHTVQSQRPASHASSLGSRSMLKNLMAESAARRHARRPFLHTMSRQLACAGIALLIVAASGWTLHQVANSGRHAAQGELHALVLPRRTLTPGASQPIGFDELCRRQDLNNDPPVDPSLQQAVFREYGLSRSSQSAYALDYLIAPTLGGSIDIKNLWPQPYSSEWNAQVKDQLEDHLHRLVCEHKVQLATAQQQIATDWIAAYKSYFDTQTPLAGAALSTSNRMPDGGTHEDHAGAAQSALPGAARQAEVQSDDGWAKGNALLAQLSSSE